LGRAGVVAGAVEVVSSMGETAEGRLEVAPQFGNPKLGQDSLRTQPVC